METLPVISLAKLAENEGQNQEIKRLYETCLDHGFFYLSDHGVPQEIIDKTIEASRNFFELTEEVKKEYAQEKQLVYPKTSRGYSPLYGECLDGDASDPKQLFDLGFDKPLSELPFTGPNLLPDDSVAPGFAQSHYALQREIMTNVFPKLLNALALALGLTKDWFNPYFAEPTIIQRVVYYPSNHGQAGKHTDTGIVTVLIQEDFPTPSLRVFTKDKWIDVPCLENTFVINLGDILQLWTDGLFVSTAHEVIHNLDRTRISIPLFIFPNIEATFPSLGGQQNISVQEVMLKNFQSIWETNEGSGRAKELV